MKRKSPRKSASEGFERDVLRAGLPPHIPNAAASPTHAPDLSEDDIHCDAWEPWTPEIDAFYLRMGVQ